MFWFPFPETSIVDISLINVKWGCTLYFILRTGMRKDDGWVLRECTQEKLICLLLEPSGASIACGRLTATQGFSLSKHTLWIFQVALTLSDANKIY